jgi:FkbM family methyltransferase
MQKVFSSMLDLMKYYKKFNVEGVKLFLQKNKKGKLLKVDLGKLEHPLFLRSNSRDIDVFHQVFNLEWYNINMNIRPKVIIDCGANIGLASVYFKTKFPDATIIAIEPESSNFELLVKNTNRYSDIHCLNYGIWNKPAFLQIVDTGLGNDGFMVKEVEEMNNNTIAAISINEIISKYNLASIDVLKIDIEGSEKELFGYNYEKWMPFVKVLIIELHDRMKKDCSKTFFKAIGNYNYDLDVYGESLICTFTSN